MGRKSRLKRDRLKLEDSNLPTELIDQLILLENHHESIYRFFPEEWQADALVNGNVWLSTLKTCRRYEDPEQGDAHEASENYNSGSAVGGSDDSGFKEVARRSGIHIGSGCSNITIDNNTRTTKLPDAYVLCSTKESTPTDLETTFGRYCVEITDPKNFFLYVSEQLHPLVKIKEGAAGLVVYKNRHYTGLENPPGPLGFVKPADLYEKQKEFRFLWVPTDSRVNLAPFLLACPKVRELCKKFPNKSINPTA